MLPPFVSATDFVARDFDYLIVGGGTAGLVVAARLSEDPDLTVGVLEAGPAALDEDAINEPGRFLQTLGSKYDWQFETVPQPGLGGRILAWPRGKVLGGSSALNLMTWNRGCREDYDAWRNLGNEGWGWDDLLPFFKKCEKFHLPDEKTRIVNREYYDHQAIGTNGPVSASYIKQYSATHQLCYDTLLSMGVTENVAHHSGSNVGVWTNPVSVNPENGKRSYAAPAYYAPNALRPNLVVLTEALVKEVVLSKVDDKWTATGVRFECAGRELTASALREVILSAGSVQSPQLLELSGVGSPEILADAGVEVKVCNLNVGENLQDHLMTVSVFEVDPSLVVANKSASATSFCYLPVSEASTKEGFEQIVNRIQALNTLSPRNDSVFKNRFDRDVKLGQFEYIFDLGNWNAQFQPDASEGKVYASMLQILQYPFSVGSLHIRPSSKSTSPTTSTISDKPVINPGYYSGPHGEADLEIMTQCIQFTDSVCRSQPLAGIVRGRVYPPASIDTDEQLKEWVVQNTTTDWHPIGTCAMGGAGGIETGVVDDRLRVYGVERLRVIDASIMPLQISAHLQATVYAIAEKGAYMISEDKVSRRE
ncbi:GMC oxidoreductase [Xylariaceae sp. AK1471]|nr:GMC oxidoreductase [Xylariaceae sp. AK1471]